MKEEKKGIFLGILAYVLWGIIPLYWQLFPQVQSIDILCYRIIWSFFFMWIYMGVTKKLQLFMQELRVLIHNRKKCVAIILAAIFISINWFTFIYSVNHGQVMQASLGYYMNPLVNVILATIILKEKLNRFGLLACIFAFIGVILLSIQTGTIPLASLAMAISFSLYGLIKKGLDISSYAGLTIETFILFPVALIYLLFFSEQGFMQYEPSLNLLLMGAGIVTAIPLLLFAESAKRIPYIILGFIQYINPTIMLLFAIFLFHEPYSKEQFISFGFIWMGIALFTLGNSYMYWKIKKL